MSNTNFLQKYNESTSLLLYQQKVELSEDEMSSISCKYDFFIY